jgi:hypothetical protein
VWIDRPVDFECAAEPAQEFLLSFLQRWLDGEVQQSETGAACEDCIQFLEAILLQGEVILCAIAIDHDRVRVLERSVGRPNAE